MAIRFEGYERRIDKITAELAKYGIASLEEAREICLAKGVNVEGLTKTEAAVVVGKDVATKALEKGIKTVVFDRGGYLYIGRVKALADAAREAGLEF